MRGGSVFDPSFSEEIDCSRKGGGGEGKGCEDEEVLTDDGRWTFLSKVIIEASEHAIAPPGASWSTHLHPKSGA